MNENESGKLGNEFDPQTGNYLSAPEAKDNDTELLVDEIMLDDLSVGDVLVVDTADDPDLVEQFRIEIKKKPRKSHLPFMVEVSRLWLPSQKPGGVDMRAQTPGGYHRSKQEWAGITQHFIQKGDSLYFISPRNVETNEKIGAAMRTRPIVKIALKKTQ